MRDADELGYAKDHPNWDVQVHGTKIRTGRKKFFPRTYVVHDPKTPIDLEKK